MGEHHFKLGVMQQHKRSCTRSSGWPHPSNKAINTAHAYLDVAIFSEAHVAIRCRFSSYKRMHIYIIAGKYSMPLGTVMIFTIAITKISSFQDIGIMVSSKCCRITNKISLYFQVVCTIKNNEIYS